MRIYSGIGRGLRDRDLDGDDFSGMDKGGFRGALLGSELIEEVPEELNWMEKMDEEPDEDLCRSFRSGESGIRKGNSETDKFLEAPVRIEILTKKSWKFRSLLPTNFPYDDGEKLDN